MPLATKVICKSELCCLTLKRREFAINFLQIPDKSIFLLKVKLGPWLVLSFTSFANCWRDQNCLLNPDVCVCCLFFKSLFVKVRTVSMSTQYITMQQPHMDTLRHVHCSNTRRRHLLDSSLGLGYTGSIWQQYRQQEENVFY